MLGMTSDWIIIFATNKLFFPETILTENIFPGTIFSKANFSKNNFEVLS